MSGGGGKGGAIRREWNVLEASEESVSGSRENSVVDAPGCSGKVRTRNWPLGLTRSGVTLRRKVLGKRRRERERDTEHRESDSPGESGESGGAGGGCGLKMRNLRWKES